MVEREDTKKRDGITRRDFLKIVGMVSLSSLLPQSEAIAEELTANLPNSIVEKVVFLDNPDTNFKEPKIHLPFRLPELPNNFEPEDIQFFIKEDKVGVMLVGERKLYEAINGSEEWEEVADNVLKCVPVRGSRRTSQIILRSEEYGKSEILLRHHGRVMTKIDLSKAPSEISSWVDVNRRRQQILLTREGGKDLLDINFDTGSTFVINSSQGIKGGTIFRSGKMGIIMDDNKVKILNPDLSEDLNSSGNFSNTIDALIQRGYILHNYTIGPTGELIILFVRKNSHEISKQILKLGEYGFSFIESEYPIPVEMEPQKIVVGLNKERDGSLFIFGSNFVYGGIEVVDVIGGRVINLPGDKCDILAFETGILYGSLVTADKTSQVRTNFFINN